jgi:hypothetical protein
MRVLLKSLVFFIVIFLIFWLTEASSKIFIVINNKNGNQDSMFWLAFNIAKGFVFGAATITIIIKSSRNWIKGLFLALDLSVLFMYLFFTPSDWVKVSPFIYPFFAVLILGFIGPIAKQYIDEELQKNSERSEIEKLRTENDIYKYTDEINRIKRKGKGVNRWDKNPEDRERVRQLEHRIDKLQN